MNRTLVRETRVSRHSTRNRAERTRVLSRKAQLINCWLVSWGEIEANMGWTSRPDSFLVSLH